MFKKIRIRFPNVSAVIVSLAIAVLLPLIILATPFFLISLKRQKKELKKEYEEFLLIHEGCEIFCYTNRKISVKQIEENVIPALPEGTHIVKLEGKRVCTKLNEKCISFMLYQLKEVGFPNLIRISNGSFIDLSLKKEIYSAINQNNVSDLPGIVVTGLNRIRGIAKNS